MSPFLERYLTATFARLDRMLAHVQLATPAHDAALPLEPLVETLAGHATARVLGAAVAAVREVFGAHAAAQVEHAAAAVLAAHRPAARPTLVLQIAQVVDLADELRARLRGRLRLAAAELREVLAAVERVLAAYHPRAVAAVFAELADDMLVARLYIDQVHASWRGYVELRATA